MGAASLADPEPDMGRLFTLEKGDVRVADKEPVQLSNGLAWSTDDSIMYFIDSVPRVVYAYDYDSNDGSIGNSGQKTPNFSSLEIVYNYPGLLAPSQTCFLFLSHVCYS